MKLIKLDTKGHVLSLDFPSGSRRSQTLQLKELIGPECDYLERVCPMRLYTALGCTHTTSYEHPGKAVCMLVDEEFLIRKPPQERNIIASWLYETDIHHYPILGNALIVGQCWEDDGIDFCGIEDAEHDRIIGMLGKTIACWNAQKGGQ